MHKQAIKHKQAIIGGGYLFTENACKNLQLLSETNKFDFASSALFIQALYAIMFKSRLY